MWMYPFSRSKDEINYNLQQDQKEKKKKKDVCYPENKSLLTHQ